MKIILVYLSMIIIITQKGNTGKPLHKAEQDGSRDRANSTVVSGADVN